MASLQSSLDRLRVPHAAVQAAAIAAAFSALRSSPGLSQAAREAAIRQCLGLEDVAAVESSVEALIALTRPGSGGAGGGPLLPRHEAADLLLTSLSVASTGTAPVLADGLLCLHIAGAEEGAAPTSVAAAWRAHPLARALLAHPAAAQPLALGVARALSRAAAGCEGLPRFGALLALLRPFLSWALLDPGLQAAQPLVAPLLHSALARVACGCGSNGSSGGEGPSPQQQLLELLAAHLPAWPLATPAQREAAAAAVADVADVLESCEEWPGAAKWWVCAGYSQKNCLKSWLTASDDLYSTPPAGQMPTLRRHCCTAWPACAVTRCRSRPCHCCSRPQRRWLG